MMTQLKNLKNNPLMLLCLLAICVGLYQKQEMMILYALLGSTALLGVISWLFSVPEDKSLHSTLPKAICKKISQSLHHSQLPLYEQVMVPVMEKEFENYQSIEVGMKVNGEIITLFDSKADELMVCFNKLKQAHELFRKREHEERDKAMTLLVFFAVFFDAPSKRDNIADVLQKIPPQAFKMLRKQAYRLFDLSYLLLEKRLVINSELVKTFADLSLFNRYDLNSAGKANPTLLESKPTLQTSLPTSECESPPAASVKTQETQPQSISENESALLEKVLPVTQPLAPKITKEEEPGEGNEENQTALKETKPTNNSEQQDLISAFISWLEKRIVSGNRQFSIESQNLVITNPEKYGNTQVFVLPGVLGKYQSRSGIEACVMKKALWDKSDLTNPIFVEKEGNSIEITPCVLSNPFESQASSQINEGEPTCVQP